MLDEHATAAKQAHKRLPGFRFSAGNKVPLSHESCATLRPVAMALGSFHALLVSLVLPQSVAIADCNLEGGEYVEEYWLMFNIETCHACPLGRYRPQEKACTFPSGDKQCPKCGPCPEGWTTKTKAAKRQEECDVEWNATSIMHWLSIWIVDAFLASLVVVIPCCCILCCGCRYFGKDSAKLAIEGTVSGSEVTVGAQNSGRHGSKSSVQPHGDDASTATVCPRESGRHGSKGSVRPDGRSSSKMLTVSSVHNDSRQGSKTSTRAGIGVSPGDRHASKQSEQTDMRSSSSFLAVSAPSGRRQGSKSSKSSVRPDGGSTSKEISGDADSYVSPGRRELRSVRIIEPPEVNEPEPSRWAFPPPTVERGPGGGSSDGNISVQEFN